MKQMTVILTVVVLFLLLTNIYPMSDDGNNEPKVVKQKVYSVNVEAKEIDTIKDGFGIDTGMTKEELEEFKKQYVDKAEELGIPRVHMISPEEYYNFKINLNAVEELKSLGLFLDKRVSTPDESFAYSVTHSDIILIGTIDRVHYFYQTETEEWQAKGALSRYYVKVDDILKGSEYFTNPVDTISYFSSIGKFVITSGDTKLKMGKKYILFLKIHKESFPENNFLRVKNSALGLEGDKIYFSDFKEKFVLNKDEVLSKIRNYEKINNSVNFYKRKYINEEGNNEK